MRTAALVGLAALLSATACRRASEPPPPVPVQPAAAVTAQFPAEPAALRTTSPAIATGNFEALYALAQERANEDPARPPAQLVGLLLAHAQYFGTLDDYDRALAAAEHAVAIAPRAPDAWLQRASARQALHQFSAALADLDRAARLGADRDDVDGVRAAILQALGRDDEALRLRERFVAARPTSGALAALAQLAGATGDTARAEALFRRAQDEFMDVSPFPLAWLYFQAGLVEERAGRPTTARELYRAAHARLPRYAPATAHLAALTAAAGDVAGAIALVEPLLSQSSDPEYAGQLADLVEKRGDTARAASLRASARAGYERLLARHPEAFADHAARFFLATGEARRADALARRNLRARPTADAYELAITAALAAHSDGEACRLADTAMQLPHVAPGLRVRAGEAFARCGRAARAAATYAAFSRP